MSLIKDKKILKKKRLEKDALNKSEYNKLVNDKVKKYENELITNESILEEIEEITSLYNDDRDSLDIQSSVDALNIIVDTQLYELDNVIFDTDYDENEYKFYPIIEDKNFNEKIYNKK